MLKIFRHILPLSLQVRFLLATAAVVMLLSLAYGQVAVVGYSVSFDKTTFCLMRGESNLLYTLSSWKDGKLQVDLPDNISIQSPTMALIYDENGKLLWMQRNVPHVVQQIQKEWLTGNGFHEMEADYATSTALLDNDKDRLAQLKDMIDDESDDGPGIPESKRAMVFDRGQRSDTLRSGQGVELSVAREIVEQYNGEIQTGASVLGGARMEVIFARQQPGQDEG